MFVTCYLGNFAVRRQTQRAQGQIQDLDLGAKSSADWAVDARIDCKNGGAQSISE